MPPLFRHVVPNVPALTAGNGKPVYRGNAPSCQAPMDFFIEWQGAVDFSAFASWYGVNSSGYEVIPGQTCSAETINAGWLGGGKINSGVAYGNLPIISANTQWGRWYEPPHNVIDVGYEEAQFEVYQSQYGGNQSDIDIEAGIEWDANLTSWRWIAVLGDNAGSHFRVQLRNVQDHTDLYRTTANVSGRPSPSDARDFTIFASPWSTQRLRAGNGVTLTLDHAPSYWGGWVASGLANCSIVISAAYA